MTNKNFKITISYVSNVCPFHSQDAMFLCTRNGTKNITMPKHDNDQMFFNRHLQDKK